MADYPYIMGVLRSLEKRLLNATDLERMIDAPNVEATFRVFNDTEYADNLLDVTPQEYKKALDDDLKQTYELYKQMIADKNLFEFLFVRYDFHNIKLSFKAKYSGKISSEYESKLGLVEPEKIRKYILETNADSPSNKLKIVIDNANKLFEQNNKPHYIDNILDKELFNYLGDLTKKINNVFINNFLKLQIDLVNIKILLRTKLMNKEVLFLQNELIDGGSRTINNFIALFETDIKTIIKTLEKYFDNNLKTILEEYEKDQVLPKLEKAFEEYELNYLKQTKRFNYGPELVVAYYYAKKNAIRNVRLIMTGKLNGISPEEIRQRIRQLW